MFCSSILLKGAPHWTRVPSDDLHGLQWKHLQVTLWKGLKYRLCFFDTLSWKRSYRTSMWNSQFAGHT